MCCIHGICILAPGANVSANMIFHPVLLQVRCVCLPEMKRNLKYNMRLSLATSEKNSGEITFASCDPCPAGKAPFASCKHIAALCYALEEFVRIGASNREFLTCTDRLQTWNQPRKQKNRCKISVRN